MPRSPSRALLLAVLVAAISVPWFDYAINRELQPTRIREHRELIDGTAAAPFRYRVLVPFAMEAAIRPVAVAAGYDAAFRAGFALFYAAVLLGLASALQSYLQLWCPWERSLVGVLIVCCCLPIALRYHAYAPWSILEPLLLTWGLHLIATDRATLVVPLTFVAALNRETAVLLPAAALLDAVTRRTSGRRFLPAILATIVCAITLIAIRLIRGAGPELLSVSDVWTMNTSEQGLKTAASAVPLLLGISGWFLAAYGFPSAPPFVRRMLLIAVLYLPLYVIFGYWYEVRLLMPLYPILVPAVVAGITRLSAPH